MIVILALAVSPVAAITGDWVEDFDHPFVGLIVFYNEDGEFIGRCSGSLLDPYNFLTAGHCVVGAKQPVFISSRMLELTSIRKQKLTR